jgi:hypothetical protein
MMIKRKQKAKETVVDQPKVETPDIQQVLAEEIANDEQTLEQQASEPQHVEQPVEGLDPQVRAILSLDKPKPNEVLEVKAKVKQYAPVSALADTHLIVYAKPLAKGVDSKSASAIRYNRYYANLPITVKDFCQMYLDHNEPKGLARNDLRWDLKHGHIRLEAQEAQSETTEPKAAE